MTFTDRWNNPEELKRECYEIGRIHNMAGLVTQMSQACGGDTVQAWRAVHAHLEASCTRGDPRSYFAGILKQTRPANVKGKAMVSTEIELNGWEMKIKGRITCMKTEVPKHVKKELLAANRVTPEQIREFEGR